MATATALPANALLHPGSIWRKWDLHVHTPESVFNNQFPHIDGAPDYEAYLSVVEKLTDIAVLGFTDYFSIDGYKKLHEYKVQDRMANIELILPNIELRLDLLVPTSLTDDTSKVKKVNAHVIFSDEVNINDIEDKFLRELKFSGLGDVQSTNEPCSLSKHQLEQLGTRLKKDHSTFTGSDYHVGCLNASIAFDHLKKVLHDHRSTFAGKYLLVLATENTGLISWDSQGHQQRKILIQGCDALFGGQPNDRLWALGQKGATPKKFIDEFGSLKPCLHGSDAHCLEKLGVPDKERFCWIKADTTFEGLRQIIFEPEDRVFIGDSPANFKHPYRVMKSVTVTDAPDWFPYSKIPLNPNLVTIIGGKGAGKSALAELIAYAGGSDLFRNQKAKDLQDTFLSKASKRTQSNLKPITGLKIRLEWADNTLDEVELADFASHGLSEEKIKYLPQKFVERVCAPENHLDLLREVERVVFQRISKSDRLACTTFADLRDLKTKAIQVKKQHLKGEIEELNRDIFAAFLKVESKDEKKKLLAKAKKEVAELAKQRPDVAQVSTDDLKNLETLQANHRLLETELTGIKQKLATVDELEATLESVHTKIEGFTQEIRGLLRRLEMNEEADLYSIEMPAELAVQLLAKKQSIMDSIAQLTTGPREGGDMASLSTAIAAASAALQLSKSKRAEFEKFEADRVELDQRVASLEVEISTIENTVESTLSAKRASRLEKYLDFFEILKEEKKALNDLYAPLRTSLEQGGDTDQKLRFASKIEFEAAAHAQSGIDLFDSRRKARYRDVELLQADIKKLIEGLQAVDFEREIARTQIQKFREGFLSDSDGVAITLGEQLKKGKTEEDFNNWFFDLSRYSVSYSIMFEGKDLSLLSPGQKGIVLLLVYLEIDQEDQRPLVIDQPEDNLDNLSVYSNLIEFFRKRKTKRQIILITHNPNLVVNTDSEQILIASYDGARNPKIMYRAGALEETSSNPDGIREQVCAILEGGTEAFQKRELKYSLL